MQPGKPPLKGADDIDDGRTSRRGDHPYHFREKREFFLDLGIKKPLFVQLLFELFESQLESTLSFGLDNIDDDLVFSPGFVHTDPSFTNNLKPIFQVEGDFLG